MGRGGNEALHQTLQQGPLGTDYRRDVQDLAGHEDEDKLQTIDTVGNFGRREKRRTFIDTGRYDEMDGNIKH